MVPRAVVGILAAGAFGLFAAACSDESRNQFGSLAQAVAAAPTLGGFVVYGESSVEVRQGATILGGDVGARAVGPGTFLVPGETVAIRQGARVAGNVLGDAVLLERGATVGDVATSRLHDQGA